MSSPILEIKDLSVHYGVIQALFNLNFVVNRGEIVTLIGSNGAGKTSILRAISGLVRPSRGEVLHYRTQGAAPVILGSPTQGLPPHEIVRRRICHAPEGRGIFLNLTVEENLDLGAWAAPDPKTLERDIEHVFSLFPRLKERRKQNAGTLSGGEQQMLAIGRSLLSSPELLLLDEPSLGLAPQIIETIFEIIVKINREGTTVLLVEQNALMALETAHIGIVLETGKITHKGNAQELLKSDQVRKAYLGE